MLDIRRLKQLRENTFDMSFNLQDEKFEGLSNNEKFMYISLMKHEKAFNKYDIKEVRDYSNMKIEDIINIIQLLDEKNLINKTDLKIQGVEVL